MSETPISDSTPHNVADLGMLCRRLERELAAAQQRIKRLEEAGISAIHEAIYGREDDALEIWRKAKEAKP